MARLRHQWQQTAAIRETIYQMLRGRGAPRLSAADFMPRGLIEPEDRPDGFAMIRAIIAKEQTRGSQ